MENKIIELEQQLLESRIAVAEIQKICDNLVDRVYKLEQSSGVDGVFLDGVDDYYREAIMKTLNSEKR